MGFVVAKLMLLKKQKAAHIIFESIFDLQARAGVIISQVCI